MWCIYIIYQLNKGLDLNTAIHQELYGTGGDLYQNDRDIGMWLSYNYARVILSQNGMRRMTPPFLNCYCICIIYACSSLVEEIKNIIIIIIIIIFIIIIYFERRGNTCNRLHMVKTRAEKIVCKNLWTSSQKRYLTNTFCWRSRLIKSDETMAPPLSLDASGQRDSF